MQSRSDDVLALPGLHDLHGGTVPLVPLALEMVVEEGAGILQFQALLLRDGALELRLPLHGSEALAAVERCRRALRAWLMRQGAQPLRLVLGTEAPLRQQGSGKPRRVVKLKAPPLLLAADAQGQEFMHPVALVIFGGLVSSPR